MKKGIQASIDDMRSLAMELEQMYCLPEGTFSINSGGELTIHAHMYMRGGHFKNSYEMTSVYTTLSHSGSIRIVFSECNQMHSEHFLLSTLYWENFANLLGLQAVIFKFDPSFHSVHSLYHLYLKQLGYRPLFTSYFRKEVNLSMNHRIMTAKQELNQSMIDTFLTDYTFVYNIVGFGAYFTSQFNYMGKPYELTFRFRDGRFYVSSEVLDYDDTPIDQSIDSFTKTVLNRLFRVHRLSNLYSPSTYHFTQLTQFVFPERIVLVIYNHLRERYSAKQIEEECAHKSTKTIISREDPIMSMTLFHETYSYDSSTKKLTFNNAVLH